MFPLPTPTKVLGVIVLALVLALGLALWRYEAVSKDLGTTQQQLSDEKATSDDLRTLLQQSEKAVAALQADNQQAMQLLVTNEQKRKTLDDRIKSMTTQLNAIGATRYDPPSRLCPSADHQPTLDDLLDAPLPPALLERLHSLLGEAGATGASGEGVAAPAADAPLPAFELPGFDLATPH